MKLKNKFSRFKNILISNVTAKEISNKDENEKSFN